MPNIDEKVVQMQFDNSEFDPNIKKSQKTFEEFEKTLEFKEGSKALKNFQKDMDKVDTKGLSKQLGKLGDSFSALETIAVGALLSIGNRLENFLNRSLRMTLTEGATRGWGDYAEKVTSVQTIMAATASQFEDAATQISVVNSQLDDLRTFADETSYSFKDMTNNIGKFTSQGVDLKTSVRAMEGISTWAALSGAGTAQAEHAMYNLSQALAVGYIQRIDWKSIDNANMSTLEFKQTAIDTAVALGTLKEVGEGVYETLSGKRGKTAALFQDLLSERWLTSDVLLKSLDRYGGFAKEILEYTNQMKKVSVRDAMRWIDEYADGTKTLDEILAFAGEDAELVGEMVLKLSTEEYNLGRRAFRAAQETKTFAEALNYTKEAVATGWSQTWELIFGDYNEARKFWTDITDDLYNIFVAGGEFRNEVLELWSKTFGRKDFVEGIQAIREFIFGTDEFAGVLDYIREAWEVVFPFWNNADSIASALVTITAAFNDWAHSLVANDETMANLQSVVTFLGRALKFIVEVGKGVILFVTPLVRWTKELWRSISGLFRSLLELVGVTITSESALDGLKMTLLALGAIIALPIKLLTKFINYLKELSNKTLPQIQEEFGKFWKGIKEFFKKLGSAFLNAGSNIVKGFYLGFTKTWKVVSDTITKLFTSLVDGVKKLLGIHSPSVVFYAIGAFVALGFISGLSATLIAGKGNIIAGFNKLKPIISKWATNIWNFMVGLFNKIKPITKTVFDWIGTKFKGLFEWFKKIANKAKESGNTLKEWFQEKAKEAGGYLKLLDQISAYIIKVILSFIIIKRLLQSLSMQKQINDLIGSIGDFFWGLEKLAKRLGTGAKRYLSRLGTANIIKAFGDLALKVSVSIMLLTGAFIALSKIKLDNVKQAGIVLASLAGGLLVFMTVLSLIAKIFNKNSPLNNTTTTITNDDKNPITKIISVFKDRRNINTGAKAVMRYALAMMLVAGALSIMMIPLGKILALMDQYNNDYKKMWIAFGMLGALMLAASIALAICSRITGKTLPSVFKLALQIILLNKVVSMLIEAFKQFYPYLIELWNFIKGIVIAIKDFAVKAWNWVKSWPTWVKVLVGIAVIFGGIILIVALIAHAVNKADEEKDTKVKKKWSDNFANNTVLPLAAALLGVALILKVIGKVLDSIKGMKWSSYGPALLTLVGAVGVIMLLTALLLDKVSDVASSMRTLKGKEKIKSSLPMLLAAFSFVLILIAEVGLLVYAFKMASITVVDMAAPGIFTGIVVAILIMVAVILNVIGKSELDKSRIAAFAAIMYSIVAMIMLLFGAVIAFALLDIPDKIWTALKQIGLMVGMLAGLLMVMAVCVRIMNGVDADKFKKIITFFITTFVSFAIMFGALTALSFIMNDEQVKHLQTLTILFSVMAVVMGVFATLIAGAAKIEFEWYRLILLIVAMAAAVGALYLLTDPLKKLSEIQNMWATLGFAASLLGVLLAFAAGLVLLSKIELGWKNYLSIAVMIAIMAGYIALLDGLAEPLKNLMAIKGHWEALGLMAAFLGALLGLVGIMLLLSLAAGALISTGFGGLGLIAVIGGLFVIVGMLMLLAEPMKDIADALKYFQDKIGAKSLLVGLYILGLSLMLGIAGALLLVATPGLIAAGIALTAFAFSAAYAGKNANYISAFFDVIKDVASWKMLGKLALFAAGLAVLGLGLQILAPGLIGAAIAFAIWTVALIVAGKNVDTIVKSFEIFKAVTWKVVFGMAKLSLGLLALSVGLGAIAVPLALVIVPVGALIGLFALLLETLYKLADNVNKFNTAISTLKDRIGDMVEIIRIFTDGVKDVGKPLLLFGAAILLMGIGLIAIGAGMLVAAIGALAIVGVLFLAKKLLDAIQRDHPRLYEDIVGMCDIFMAFADWLTTNQAFLDMLQSIFAAIGYISEVAAAATTAILAVPAFIINGKDYRKARKEAAKAGYLALYKDGKFIGFGYADGMADSYTVVYDAGGKLVNESVKGVEKTAEIHSPSRVFYRLAQLCGEGFGDGFIEAIPTVRSKAQLMCDAAVEVVEESAGKISEDMRRAMLAGQEIEGLKVKSSINRRYIELNAQLAEYDALLAEKKKIDARMTANMGLLTDEDSKRLDEINKSDVYRQGKALAKERDQIEQSLKAMETQTSETAKGTTTLKDTVKGIGSDISDLFNQFTSGKITFKEFMSGAWASLKENGGAFIGDKIDQLKEWAFGEGGPLSEFKDIFDKLKSGDLFSGLDLESLLPDTGDPYDNFNLDDYTTDIGDFTSDTGTGGNTINTYEFVQNNYSPKALSRIEIYRQTNRQFNNFRTREVLAR